MKLHGQVTFVGMQRDVRPYLWAADAFVFPSLYEVFSLSSLQAAAAGLVLVVSSVNGVDEFVRDGENGVLIEPTADSIAHGIRRCLALSPGSCGAIGEQVRSDVQAYAIPRFVAAWREFLSQIT